MKQAAMREGIGFWEGFAGTVNGKIIGAPLWVDLAKPPGETSMAAIHAPPGWYLKMFNPLNFFWTVHLVWAVIALFIYFVFPYDFTSEASKNMHTSLIAERVAIHVVLMHLYFGFWHLICYGPFRKTSRNFSREVDGPSMSQMIHNLYYATLGAIQSGIWDCCIIYVYANGVLPYQKDSEAFSLSQAGLVTALLIFLTGIWRDFHFYCAHRLIHFRFIYKHVHSLHHRNIDIESYSGLTMHPVEHLYYYSCTGAAMFLGASPFIPFCVLIHALISPAASHSGFEDSWQSDQFHNLHHAKFECNYGTNGLPLDRLCGTFREKFGASETYKGEWSESADSPAPGSPAKGNKKPYLRGGLSLQDVLWASPQQAVHDLVTCVAIPYALVLFFEHGGTWPGVPVEFGPQLAAALLAFGPIATGLGLWYLCDNRAWSWPFHKEPVTRIGPFLLTAMAAVVAPVYFTMLMAGKAAIM